MQIAALPDTPTCNLPVCGKRSGPFALILTLNIWHLKGWDSLVECQVDEKLNRIFFMNKGTRIALLPVCLSLIIYGINVLSSTHPDALRKLGHALTGQTSWLLLAGVASFILGFALTLTLIRLGVHTRNERAKKFSTSMPAKPVGILKAK